ncbi:helix-turn-helix domain-containing protein [Candidatus Kaiserbacteria bacterium]|nr:helix-turn-helix domain-containing protein [Candidatus Kaiserbacteria bacterium]
MVRNEEKFKQAVEFRKRGFTYSEIAKICGISKSTVSNWLSKQKFSQVVANDNAIKASRDNKKRISLMNKARTAERQSRYAEAKRSADTEYKHYKTDQLFVAGLMLYLSEGDTKNSRLIRVSTKNMDVHKIFVRFLVEYLGVDKKNIRFWLLLYPTHNLTACAKKWSRTTNISLANFGKSQIIQSTNKAKPLHYGVGNTIIGDTVLKKKLMRWIELSLKEIK